MMMRCRPKGQVMEDDYMGPEDRCTMAEELSADQQMFPLMHKSGPVPKGPPEAKIATPLRLSTRSNADGECKPCQEQCPSTDPIKAPCRLVRAKSFSPDRNLKDAIMKVVHDGAPP